MLDLTYEMPKPKVIAGLKHDWELVIGMEIQTLMPRYSKMWSKPSARLHLNTLNKKQAKKKMPKLAVFAICCAKPDMPRPLFKFVKN